MSLQNIVITRRQLVTSDKCHSLSVGFVLAKLVTLVTLYAARVQQKKEKENPSTDALARTNYTLVL